MLLGVVLAGIGLFALKWVGDMDFADVSRSIWQAANEADNLSGADHLVGLYMPRGAVTVFVMTAIIPSLWTLGVAARSRRDPSGLTKNSLREGNVEPTRVLFSVITGLFLLYHLISLLMLADSVGRHDHIGPGPWLLMLGTALALLGVIIGPHVPDWEDES